MRAYRKVDEPYEIKIEPGKLILLGVGAGLTLLLVFLVGVLVGKSLWGAKVQFAAPAPESAASAPQVPTEAPKSDGDILADLSKPDGPSPGVRPAVPAGAEPGVETRVGVAQVAPLGAPSPSREEVAPKPPQAETRVPGSEAEKETATALPSETKVTAPKAAEAAKAAKASQTVPPTQAAKAAAPLPKGRPEAPLPTPQFTVQVGSFRDRSSADDQAKKIASRGVATQVVLVSVEGRNWYRVQVGRFETRAEAEAQYQKKMRPKGVQGFVTTR